MDCPLQVLILGLISTLLLWEGASPVKFPGYDLSAPANVAVEEGLCTIIPCNFTYDPSHASKTAPLYGFWFGKRSFPKELSLVATNSPEMVASFAVDRFHLIGNLKEGNCSLLIFSAQKNDTRNYIFRMDKGNRAKFIFKDDYTEPFLKVTDRQAPEIQILGKLRVGHPANITCATLRSCSWQSPKINWKGFSKNVDFHLWLNGTQVYSSVLDFLPSVADHNRNLTCKVTYRNGSSSVSKEKTVQLDVNFPPQTPVISVARLRPNRNLRNFTKASRITIEKGDSIVLRCKVKGNPLPNVTWAKGSQILGTPLQPSNVLDLSDMKEEDVGEYQCQAANTEGFAEASFEVSMAPEDKNNCLLSMVTGALLMLAVVILITGVILVSKRCLRKRKTVTNLETEPKDSALALGKTSPHLKNPSTLDLAVRQMDRISLKPESAEESADRNPRDPEEIYYATLTFNVPNTIPDATSKEIQTDYAEIRHYNSQGQQDMKI